MLLFLYGTLLNPKVLAACSGDERLARRMRPATLAGWRRVALRGTPYPTLVPDPGGRVGGAVVRAGAATLARLKAYEGPGYRLTPVRVVTRHGPLRARAWIALPWRADPCRAWTSAPPV